MAYNGHKCCAALFKKSDIVAYECRFPRCALRHTGGGNVKKKNMAVITSLLELFANSGLTRSDAVVSLGGGVVGDTAGFAAGVYMRGVAFVQIPTTLLASVDASVGGKTGVDLSAGKNLAGVFHQPKTVLCDVLCLDTLPSEVFADGVAEVIKTGDIIWRGAILPLRIPY